MRIALRMFLVASLALILAACGSTSSTTDAGQDGNGCVPETEVCNGRDDDCDNLTDEDLDTDNDNDGHYTTDSCASPHDDCNDGDNQIYPGHAEDCDGKDNDCDGTTDEGCDCDPGPPAETRACSTDEGECTVGEETCQANGTFGECSGQGPEPEICDGLDNDCDATTDNPTTQQPCDLTVGVCSTAVRNLCEPCDYGADYEETETSCDTLDNDCDDLTDEELDDLYEENEDCAHRAVLGDLDEALDSNDFTVIEGSLSRWTPQGNPDDDVDWYVITLDEATHVIDCLDYDYQCYEFVLRLELPAGEDHTHWEMCIVDGKNGSCADFGNPAYTFCTEEADWQSVSNSYSFTLGWPGECIIEDGGDFYILVRNTSGNRTTRCDPYRLYLQFWYGGPATLPEDC